MSDETRYRFEGHFIHSGKDRLLQGSDYYFTGTGD